MKQQLLVLLACAVLITLACEILTTPTPPDAALVPTLTPSPQSTAAGPLVTPAKPTWWPADLQIPNGAVLTSGGHAPSVWSARNLNVDGFKDTLLAQATSAEYQVYLVTQSQGTIYDLLFTKGGVTFTLNITQGRDATILTGDRTGVMRLQLSGAVSETLDLPLRERLNLTRGSEVAIGTAVPNDKCRECQYYINIHIAPFNGPGNYASKPAGIYIIDVELVPGGTEDHDDYRWAKQCTVRVQDSLGGSFDCKGLENVNDNTKLIDIAGNWQQPPAPL